MRFQTIFLTAKEGGDVEKEKYTYPLFLKAKKKGQILEPRGRRGCAD